MSWASLMGRIWKLLACKEKKMNKEKNIIYFSLYSTITIYVVSERHKTNTNHVNLMSDI